MLDRSTGISSIRANGVDCRVLAYADDIAILTSDVSSAFTEVQHLAAQFGRISGYKLNISKTLFIQSDSMPHSNTPVVREAIYLGIKITAAVDLIPDLNTLPIVESVNTKLERLDHLHLSLYGRSNVLKMLVLPKFLYIFRTIALIIPQNSLLKAESICHRFLWGYRRAQRAAKWMCHPRDRGGWSVPNLVLYYWAAMVQHMGVPLVGDRMEIFPAIRPTIYEIGANGILTQILEPSYFKKTRFKVVLAMFVIWQKIRRKLCIPKINLYTPFKASRLLPSIFQDQTALRWQASGLSVIGDLVSQGQMLSFSLLRDTFSINIHDFFKYLQIQSFLGRQQSKTPPMFQKIALFDLVFKKARIGLIYQHLLSSYPDDLEVQNSKWGGKFGNTSMVIKPVLELASHALVSGSLQTQCYMALFDLYYTPAKITKWGGRQSVYCPRCGLYAADSVHMFFSCPNLQGFLEGVERFLNSMLNISCSITPEMVITGSNGIILDRHTRAASILVFIAMSMIRLCIT